MNGSATESPARERLHESEPSPTGHTFDDRLVQLLRRNGIVVLRVVLGVVFLWFGALKLADVSPAASLIAKTVPFPTG